MTTEACTDYLDKKSRAICDNCSLQKQSFVGIIPVNLCWYLGFVKDNRRLPTKAEITGAVGKPTATPPANCPVRKFLSSYK